MAKVGSFFKGFFKVIFTVVALVAGLLMLLMYAFPFVYGEVSNILGSAAYGISGFALAFGGDLVATSGDTTEVITQVSLSAGILVSFILLAFGLVLALFYLFVAWGKKAVSFKKGIGVLSSACFIAAAILCFCVMPLSASSLTVDIQGLTTLDFSEYFEIGTGAIWGGIFGIAGCVTMLIATLLGPKD